MQNEFQSLGVAMQTDMILIVSDVFQKNVSMILNYFSARQNLGLITIELFKL